MGLIDEDFFSPQIWLCSTSKYVISEETELSVVVPDWRTELPLQTPYINIG